MVITVRNWMQAAPAKVNLALDILGPRPDGYHEMRTVMQAVSLADTVSLRETAAGFSLWGVTPPEGRKSLEQRAAEAFFQALDRPMPGLEVLLEKRSPAYAGLGGGSADVAALLRLLREAYCPAMPPEELERIGLSVGSDVPFCLRGGAALAEGRGERLTDLPPLPECRIVLCKPDFGLPTPEMFARLRFDGEMSHPDIDSCAAALMAGDLEGAARRMGNVFESVLEPEERREIEAIKEVLLRHGALNAVMSGSGPTVFGVFSQNTGTDAASAELSRRYRQVYLAVPEGNLYRR